MWMDDMLYPKCWIVVQAHGTRHVIPLNDSTEHEQNMLCACRPAIDMVEHTRGYLWIATHASLDGRESGE